MESGEYKPTIGMEIHAELRTTTKMFCNSRNDPDETRPNVNICPVCLAHPGTLPVINREAVRHVLRVGVALGGTLAGYTEFNRKNYFYPDLPKGYQISQYGYPLVSGGELAGVPITRVHLEEDTASSVHDDATGATLIDFNRSGVPLMELVTDPVIHSAEEAVHFARELQLLLQYLGASHANLEKGEMRVEANVSVAQLGAPLGTKVEIKNLNSFRAMERAVAYEITRQIKVISGGGVVAQETRGWDENNQVTFAQRRKEGSADYRYFPDPDLPPLDVSDIPSLSNAALTAGMPELPQARRARYLSLGIRAEDAGVYVRDRVIGDFFEQVVAGYSAEQTILASNYISNDLVSMIRDAKDRDTSYRRSIPVSVEHFRKLMNLISAKKLSSRVAKDILQVIVRDPQDPEDVARSGNLLQNNSREELEMVIRKAIAGNGKVVSDYRAGKLTSLEYLVGQCMKELRGAADAGVIRDLLRSNIA